MVQLRCGSARSRDSRAMVMLCLGIRERSVCSRASEGVCALPWGLARDGGAADRGVDVLGRQGVRVLEVDLRELVVEIRALCDALESFDN